MKECNGKPAQLYRTVKTHKFVDVNDITFELPKFRPVIAQIASYVYKTGQVILEYSKLLYESNDFNIKINQDFTQFIREQPPLE